MARVESTPLGTDKSDILRDIECSRKSLAYVFLGKRSWRNNLSLIVVGQLLMMLNGTFPFQLFNVFDIDNIQYFCGEISFASKVLYNRHSNRINWTKNTQNCFCNYFYFGASK